MLNCLKCKPKRPRDAIKPSPSDLEPEVSFEIAMISIPLPPAPDFPVSVVSCATDINTREASFRDLLAGITEGRWQNEVEVVRLAYARGGKKEADGPKKRLPAVLWSGIFLRRASDALKKHSGLICVDLDHLDDKLEATRDLICADPHTLAAFVSPTGTGLKVLFRCDADRDHATSFRAAERYVFEHFGLEIDKACKDVSRLCFVSWDPDAFIARDAVPLDYPADEVTFRAPHDSMPGNALSNNGTEPWDDYDLRCDLPALLTSAGWKPCGRYGWTRPGKDSGISATWNKVPGRFFVFSSSAEPFEPNHVYRPWHVYALLAHGGNWSAAVAQLRKDGFGAQRPKPIAGIPDKDIQAEIDAANEESATSKLSKGQEDQSLRILGSDWPPPISADEFCENPPPTPPELIEGMLYVGGTMLLAGPSKSHKTFSALDVGIAIASGEKWLGHRTNKSPVLYLNLELQDFASADRISKISAARGHKPPHDLKIWNLRGHTITLAALTAQLPIMIKEHGAKVVCIDPHYKVSAVSDMEENSNDSQGKLLTLLEGLCLNAGAALILTHHFAKGDSSVKNAIDRASGGGVFARWGDVMMTFTPHEDEDCMTVEMALRNFSPIEPFVVRWIYPRWQRDDEMDPKELKRAGGKFAETITAADLLDALGDSTMTPAEWIKAAGISRSSFYRKRQELVDLGKVVQFGGLFKKATSP